MTGSLLFGAVTMVVQTGDEPVKTDPTADVFTVKALSTDEGTTFGSAEPITEQLDSFLQYGAIVVTRGWNNREGTLVVSVRGTGRQLDLAAAALFAEVGKMNLLTYTPPEANSSAKVMTVVNSWLEPQPNSGTERGLAGGLGRRRYAIHLVCQPFNQDAVLQTIAALAASGVTNTNVDNGSATTGWTATVAGSAVTPSVVSGAVQAASASPLVGTAAIVMTRTGSITTSSTKYLVVDWKLGPGLLSTNDLTATGDGITLPVIASQASPTAGYTRTWFSVAASSVAVLALSTTTYNSGGITVPITMSLSIDNIDRTDIRPGSARMQARTLAITGAAPTTGSLSVQHSTTALGDSIVYTCPDDGGPYVPWCRAAYAAAGTADATALSGSYDLVSTTPRTFTIPVAALPPGEYMAMGHIRAVNITGTEIVTVATAAVVNGVTVATGPMLSASFTGLSTTVWAFGRFGMLHLPAVDMAPGASSVMTFTVSATGAPGLHLDDLFLFNMTTGDLTQIACGTGTAASGGPANRMWIDSPALVNDGDGRYLIGFAADRSDSFYPGFPTVAAEGIHRFDPRLGPVKAFSITANPAITTPADVAFAYYPASPV